MAPVFRILFATSLLFGVLTASPDMLSAQTEASEMTVIADQVRSQGFSCDNPKSAARIEADSTPEQPAYLLTCENATYEVRLVPDQAAKIVKVK